MMAEGESLGGCGRLGAPLGDGGGRCGEGSGGQSQRRGQGQGSGPTRAAGPGEANTATDSAGPTMAIGLVGPTMAIGPVGPTMTSGSAGPTMTSGSAGEARGCTENWPHDLPPVGIPRETPNGGGVVHGAPARQRGGDGTIPSSVWGLTRGVVQRIGWERLRHAEGHEER